MLMPMPWQRAIIEALTSPDVVEVTVRPRRRPEVVWVPSPRAAQGSRGGGVAVGPSAPAPYAGARGA